MTELSSPSAAERLSAAIRDIPNFPKEGIAFKDITTLLQDREMLSLATKTLSEPFIRAHVDVVVGLEARGFIFGAPVAVMLNAGFVPVRKAGKLPWKTNSVAYTLEYGESVLEIHQDAVTSGQNVLIVDDVLATGGSARAALDLVASLGGNVGGFAFLMELTALHGREKLMGHVVHSVIEV